MTPTHIDYIPMSPLASAVRQSMYPTEFKGGGLKKIVSIAAMVFIPMAAPAISSSIAASGFLGASATGVFSTWAGSAIVGAGLGAVAAKATGQDWKKGALMGGIGGGLAGYSSGMGSPFGSPSATLGFDGNPITATGGGNVDLNAVARADLYGTASPIGPAGTGATSSGNMWDNASGVDAATGMPTDASGNILTDSMTATTSQNSGLVRGFDGKALPDAAFDSSNNYQGYTAPAPAPTAGVNTGGTGNVNTAGTGTGAGPNSSTTWTEAFQKGFSKDNMMKSAMNMGGNLLSSALVSDELPAEQQAQINAAQAEVDRLTAQGAEVDALKLASAKQALRDANNISVEWLRKQKYAQSKNRGSRQTRDEMRTASAKGYNQAGMANIGRRGVLDTEKAASTSGEQAALGAYDTRSKLFAQANTMFPTSTGTAGLRTSMQSIWLADEKRKEAERKAYGNIWGGLTGQGIS